MARFVQEYTNNINDVDEITLKRIFKDYFFKYKLYAKSTDLDYRLIEITQEMYKQLNNAGDPEKYVRDKSKYIYAHKILSDTIMNPKFIKMLDAKGFKNLKVPREVIEKALLSLVDDKAAILLKELYPDVKIKTFLKHLSLKQSIDLERRLDKLHYRKRYRLLNDALNSLIELIKFDYKI